MSTKRIHQFPARLAPVPLGCGRAGRRPDRSCAVGRQLVKAIAPQGCREVQPKALTAAPFTAQAEMPQAAPGALFVNRGGQVGRSRLEEV